MLVVQNPLPLRRVRGFLFCVAVLLAMPAVAQDLDGLSVGLKLESLRISAVIDGRVERDERALVDAPGNSVRTFAHQLARAEAPLDFLPIPDTPWLPKRWWLGAFADSQVWASGVGAEALAVANSASAGAGLGAAVGTIPIALRSQSLRRRGMSVAAQWALPAPGDSGAQLLMRGNWFTVTNFQAASADGAMNLAAGGAIGLQVNSNELALGGQSLFIQTEPVHGQGFTLDARLRWHRGSGSNPPLWVQAEVRDLGPPVRLPSVLQTVQTANTQTIGRDAQGYLQVQPLLSGQYRNVAVDVVVEPQFALSGGWGFATQWQALAGIYSAAAVQRWHVGVQRGNQGSATGWGWRAKLWQGHEIPPALDIAVYWRNLHIGFQADRLNPEAARVWGWSLGWVF